MFGILVDQPTWGGDERMSDRVRDDGGPGDDLDGALERLLADAEACADEWSAGTPDQVGWIGGVDEGAPAPTFGTCEPSGWLALELDDGTADLARLSDTDLIEAIIGFDRLASWAAARQARLLAALADRRPADRVAHVARTAGAASEYAPDEVGVALKLARGIASARIDLARRLLTTLPDTHALWESGRIDTSKARAIDDATAVLSDTHARAVEARVLPRAPEQTLAQLKAALARAVLAVDPDGAESRHREARRDRRVVVTQEAEGMASLWALITATDATGAYTWLTRLARGLGPDDPRTMDTRRADILAALLNGRLVTDADDDTPETTETTGEDGTSERDDDTGVADNATGDATGTGDTTAMGDAIDTRGDAIAGRPIHPVAPGKPLIQIVMSHSTLIGVDDQPADLVGHGPIPASLARETAADAVWRRIVTDPLSGTVLDYGRTTYHPPAALADHVRVRDVHCRFPGCRRIATDAELDHAIPWAEGGSTSAANLHALCLHHHLLKGHAGWRLTTHPDGRLTWTTPTGHRHTTAPHDYGPEPPPAGAPPPAPHTAPNADRPEHRAAGTAAPTVQPVRDEPDRDDPDPPPF